MKLLQFLFLLFSQDHCSFSLLKSQPCPHPPTIQTYDTQQPGPYEEMETSQQ
jgi:hypothetical protein